MFKKDAAAYHNNFYEEISGRPNQTVQYWQRFPTADNMRSINYIKSKISMLLILYKCFSDSKPVNSKS